MTSIKSSTPKLPPGLIIINDVIKPWQEELLIRKADEKKWDSWLKRRTQHYGYQYHYDTRRLGSAVPISLFIRRTRWHIENIIRKKTNLKILGTKSPADSETNDWSGKYPAYFDQCIANEYMPGQGIGTHTDQQTIFTDIIAIVCLGSDTSMIFAKGNEKIEVRMPARALVIMTGESRYSWTHCIENKKADRVNGILVPRKRRISLTFRRRLIKN
jgi:alkylated DNA repair dioxygenase AlkB